MPDDVHRQGKTIAEIKEGDSLTVTESISERDLLIYLGRYYPQLRSSQLLSSYQL